MRAVGLWQSITGLEIFGAGSGNAGLAMAMLALLLGLGLAAMWTVLSGRGEVSFMVNGDAVPSRDDLRHGLVSSDHVRDDRRQILLRSFEGDVHGQAGERVLAILKKSFGGGIRGDRTVSIMTGFGDRHERRDGLVDNGGGHEGVAQNNGHAPRLVQVMLEGRVSGFGLQIGFFPDGPVVSPLAGNFVDDETDADAMSPANEMSRRHSAAILSYECFDFPLCSLQGLTRSLPGVQPELMGACVAGLVSRGVGIDGLVVGQAQFAAWGERLAGALPGLKLTQPLLFHEAQVVAAWCFLIGGVLANDRERLARALSLYQEARDFDWRNRNAVEWAGIKANEAIAALSLGQLGQDDALCADERGPTAAQHYQRVLRCAAEGMRYFRRDNYPASWGKLMCKVALANGALSAAGATGVSGESDVGPLSRKVCRDTGNEEAEKHEDTYKAPLQDNRSIARSLDHAISFWAALGDRGSIAEAHFAKGWLAQNTARQHMGLQDWERAENAYLAALSESCEDDHWPTRRRADIRFELGRLYLGWGTRFGDKLLLEKAIHHFSELDQGGERRVGGARLAASRRRDTGFLLAQAHLNYGGITNDRRRYERAVDCFAKLREEVRRNGAGDRRRQEIDRAFGVACARLALERRDRGEARRAISLISAVIGQQGGLWPSRDVLLRLRARLRELLFLLEGDDIALDRAINDRRELVAQAGDGPRGLRWSVEVGDLVGLLSRRQYKLDGEAQDFHEAHYLLETSIGVCTQASGSEAGPDQQDEGYDIPHIEAGLHLKLGKLLASFARVKFDLSALNEAVTSFERFLELKPRGAAPLERAEVLNDIGQIMMDRSEHYGHHDGLRRAARCFAEAHDIYLEAKRMDQANRMRRFLENAEAAILAYQVAASPVKAGPV